MLFNKLSRFSPAVFQVWRPGARTKTGPSSPICTAIVRFRLADTISCILCATVLSGLGPVPARAEGARERARAAAVQSQRGAEGWLTLERDQREARAAVAPGDLSESQRLRLLEQQERARYRAALQDERAELDAERRRERRAPGQPSARPGAEARLQGRILEQQRNQESLRLRMQMDRQTRGLPSRATGTR